MEAIPLKSRAIAFAFCIGAVAFILAMLAGAEGRYDAALLSRGVIVALVCGVMSWAAAEHSIAGIAEAVDAASARISEGAQGDLSTPTPPQVAEALPELAVALDGMFRQVRANLDSVHAMAMFDPVTSLSNRTNFRREADRMLRNMPDERVAALFFIDLDNFKTVNDTLGHAQGDQLLAMVANRLRAICGAEAARRAGSDALVGRLAGDEFTLLFPEIDGEAGASRIARALLAALSEPFDLAGHSIEVGASIGVALRPGHGFTLTAMMRAADVAMYHAKACGRGQYQFYSDALGERLAGRARLENDLRAAIQREEFALLVQPQVSLRDGRIVAGEALLRWDRPGEGLVRPEAFLAAAEDSGLIIEIGDWAIDAVAKMAGEWSAAGLTQRLAVNLSPRQIGRADFFPRLRAALKSHAVSPRIFEFELTETLASDVGDNVLVELAALRGEGAIMTIDDFGAGRTNLSRLRTFPVDRIKIDHGLIAEIATDAAARTIVQSIVGLVHGLGCEAVAEGVEGEAELEMLRVMGCDAVQGYAIAHPMPAADYAAWNTVARSSLAG